MSRVTPPFTALRQRDRQLSRGLGECSLFSSLCLHVGSDEAILRVVISEVTTLTEYGVMLNTFFPPLDTQLKVITSAASSITSRNKHYNHVLHPKKKKTF